MTPDIERIETEQVLRRKFPKEQWGSEIVGDIDALLAAIDELTAENEALKRMYEGNFIMGRVAERKAWLDEIT